VWTRQGYVIATEGNVIDYRAIMVKLDELAQMYDIRDIGFDRWGDSAHTGLADAARGGAYWPGLCQYERTDQRAAESGTIKAAAARRNPYCDGWLTTW